MKMELAAAVTFGLEAVARREIEGLGYKALKTEDGRVTFEGDIRAAVRANLWLRTADRVQIILADVRATEFEDVYQTMKGIAWEEWIPMEGNFTVNAVSVKSRLSSVPAIQKVAERALIDRLRDYYPIERFPKTGAVFDIKLSLHKDRAVITLDTTGPGLNKRGYRRLIGKAPLKETLASAMVQLSFWQPDRVLADPCCGSGTIPIEAAMMAQNIAPGLSRQFTMESWDSVDSAVIKEERSRCYRQMTPRDDLRIYASDIDREAIKIARENAAEAGVEESIDFTVMDVKDFRAPDTHGVMISNPPYGERIGDQKTIEGIYSAWRRFFSENPGWSLFCLTSDKEAEDRIFGRPADRRRKLYNGRMEVYYYQFHGERPKRENVEK